VNYYQLSNTARLPSMRGIEQLNLKRVVLVGHSIGGPIILEAAS
jgi:predicted alpha/beta hydrolase family esterase